MEVFRRDDVGRGHRPVGGDFDVALLEDEIALEVLNDGVAELPRDFVEGVNAGAREVAVESEAHGTGGCAVGGRGGLLGLL